jgi:hypothetical protein
VLLLSGEGAGFSPITVASAAARRRDLTPTGAASRADVIETLHSLAREGDRSPLYVITAMDREGHVLDAAACDPEEYAEYR